MSMYCCDKFAKMAGELQSLAGGGFSYPTQMRPKAQFESDGEGLWNIYGCCGGGCYVVEEMKFCPFCGRDLATLPTIHREASPQVVHQEKRKPLGLPSSLLLGLEDW